MCTIYWQVDNCSGNSQVNENKLFETIESFERSGYTITGFELSN